jgi:hypothetical protein
MPRHVRGALVTEIAGDPRNVCKVVWQPAEGPARIPTGQILLSWSSAGRDLTDVTARLGLPGEEVLLATWPALAGEWSGVVHPTVLEVMGLHAALKLAAKVLELAAFRQDALEDQMFSRSGAGG